MDIGERNATDESAAGREDLHARALVAAIADNEFAIGGNGHLMRKKFRDD